MIVNMEGKATDLSGATGNRILCFIANDAGKWGKGFCLEVSQRWPDVKKIYMEYLKDNDEVLGNTLFIKVEPTITVAVMLAQHGIFPKCIDDEMHEPIRYVNLENCLKDVIADAKEKGATVHMPEMGHDFGGAKWSRIAKTINRLTVDNVYVYKG